MTSIQVGYNKPVLVVILRIISRQRGGAHRSEAEPARFPLHGPSITGKAKQLQLEARQQHNSIEMVGACYRKELRHGIGAQSHIWLLLIFERIQ
jgi:hypothetical protein